MRQSLLMLIAITVGCSSQSIDTAVTPPVETGNAVVPSESVPSEASSSHNVIAISPDNTIIQFVGTHVGPVPDPNARTGSFTDFLGEAIVADDELRSVTVEIQMASVQTAVEKLTNHLKAEDFFDVREYPTAKFASTRIARDEDGNHIITGDLTLHSKTNEIDFPATVGLSDGKLTLSAKLKLDRTAFGMTQNTDKVNKEVNLSINVGTPGSAGDQAEAGGGEGQARREGRRGQGGRGGRFDPEAIFAERDTDNDGKLSKDEMHERMRERLDDVDTDGDGAVSLEEMKAMFASFRGRGGRQRGGDANSANDQDRPARPERPEE